MIIQEIDSLESCSNGWVLGNYIMYKDCFDKEEFGKVYKGKNKKNGKSVAIKCIYDQEIQLKDFERMINTVPTHSPFILKLQDVFLVHQNKMIYLIFDKFKGSLQEYCDLCFSNFQSVFECRKFPEREALEIFCQIAEGCITLWRNGVTHQDIKPDNILYKSDKSIKKNIFLISGYGISTHKINSPIIDISTLVYLAPEILQGEKHNYLCDVWSLGLTLHQLLFGLPYYSDVSNNPECLKKKILTTNYNLTQEEKSCITQKTAALLNGMIKNNPKERLTLDQLDANIQEFKEYEVVREIMSSTQHEQKFEGNLWPDFKNTILNYAECLSKNSWEMNQKGYYDRDRDMCKEAYEIYHNFLGEDAVKTRSAIILYAQGLNNTKNYEKAREFGEKGLNLYKHYSNENDSDFGGAYTVLGNIYYNMKDYKMAQEYHEKAVELRIKVFGENHRETATTLNNLGNSLQDVGNLQGAKDAFTRSMNIYIGVFGEDHFETSYSYYNLSGTLYLLKEYASALKYCRMAKIIREKYFGINHENTKLAQQREMVIIAEMKKAEKQFFLCQLSQLIARNLQ